MWTLLDNNCLFHIFEELYLNPYSLLRVCKRWNLLLKQNDLLWKRLCYRRWLSLSFLPSNVELREAVVNTKEKEQQDNNLILNSYYNFTTHSWRELFKQRHLRSFYVPIKIKQASKKYLKSLDKSDLKEL